MARKDGKDRGLLQRKGDAAWWVRYSCGEHEHQERIGPKSLARMVYQQRKVAVKTEGFCPNDVKQARRRQREQRFNQVMERYLEWCREERPRSIVFRETASKQLLPHFGTIPISRITRLDVEGYLAKRRRSDARPATINRERSVLSHCYQRAIDWGLVSHNPVKGTQSLKEENEAPRPIADAEEVTLFAVLPERYHAVITFAIHTGLRLGEIRHQLWDDIDLQGRELTVSRPKSGRKETIPLNETAYQVLVQNLNNEDRVFPGMPKSMSKLFSRYAKRVGLADVTFHCLRDTYISRLAPYCNVHTLMTLARHRNFQTTQRYLKVDNAHLREAVDQLVRNGRNGDATVSQNGRRVGGIRQAVEYGGAYFS